MELCDFARQVLYGTTLKEKLMLSPKKVIDTAPAEAFTMPSSPGRPMELRISERGVKADFPGTNRLDQDQERGKMLHFLANHELLATELMALVLLKFPNAPKTFRMGVYQTLKEEQAHTLMYIRRMKECGIEFGELPVNDYFWRVVAPMEEPMDFVSRLSLVFEQANLDYSLHYAKLFREVGDDSTARVLEHIYEDEIEHVGHGLKWFRKWKDQSKSDWEALQTRLHFPLSAVRAKGVAPFNAEGRRKAGIDEEWIDALEVEEQSRGRTPVVHWFNPNAESEELARMNQFTFSPKRNVSRLEKDLDMVPLAWVRRDDVLLLRQQPSRQHLKNIRAWGFAMPECIELADSKKLRERKMGGVRPWAWQHSASELLAPYKSNTSENVSFKWCEKIDSDWMSKKMGFLLEQSMGEATGEWCETLEQVEAVVTAQKSDVLLKAAYANAGRGHCRLLDGQWTDSARGWVKRVLREHKGVLVEPWLDRVIDFSAQYEMSADGTVKHLGMTRVLNDALGRFRGCLVLPKWAQGLDEELSRFLFKDANVSVFYKHEMPILLENLMRESGYVGALGVDAMVFRDAKKALRFRPVVELNVRHTMGRVALELLKKTTPGFGGLYTILRKSEMQQELSFGPESEVISGKGLGLGHYVLNDPSQAEEFLATYRVAKPAELLEQSNRLSLTIR